MCSGVHLGHVECAPLAMPGKRRLERWCVSLALPSLQHGHYTANAQSSVRRLVQHDALELRLEPACQEAGGSIHSAVTSTQHIQAAGVRHSCP